MNDHLHVLFSGKPARLPGIGIDFGTSNGSVAVFDGQAVRSLSFGAAGEGDLMPTALYVDRERLPTVGQPAVDRYLADNRDRQIKLKKETVGRMEMTVTLGEGRGDAETIEVDAHAWTDQDLPGRLFRGIKSWLGDPALERVQVFGKSFALTALITPVLKELAARATAARPVPGPVHVGRPVHYVGDSAPADRTALERMVQACQFAAIGEPVLLNEPVAAAISYLRSHPLAVGSRYLVFDFGGGTLDLTALAVESGGLEVLANDGTGLGGNRIDQMIYAEKVFPHLGRDLHVYRSSSHQERKRPFRFDDYAPLLLNWQNTYQLNTPVLRKQITEASRTGDEAARQLDRLRTIVTRNLSYEILSAIEAAKIRLSREPSVALDFPEIDLHLTLDREEFARILQPALADIDALVDRTLEAAETERSALAGIICTGGSSEIPLIREHLTRLTGAPLLRHDAFTGIAAGLAIANAYDLPGS
ncbi:MAG: Hsp70 family protein [Opitutales bacterium]